MADFRLDWHRPLHLSPSPTVVYEVDLVERIPFGPGVYIFVRAFGSTRIPLYVGQAINLRRRIEGQLKTNVKLMMNIKNSPRGSRQLIFGVFTPKKGQQLASSLDRIERALIRHYIESGSELFNTQGTSVPMETLTSERPQQLNKVIPKTLTFAKQKTPKS